MDFKEEIIMRPSTSCMIFGAYRSVIGIKNTVVLIHSTVGCHWGTMAMHIPSHLDDVKQACSVIYENDIIYGGDKALEDAIKLCLEEYKPQALFIVTGCTPEIMNDDINGVIKNIETDTPIIPILSAGFKGDIIKGYMAGIKSLVKNMVDGERVKDSINLIGMFSDDFMAESDIASIKNMFKNKIHINSVLSYDSYENIINAPRAEYNVVLRGFEQIGKLMEKKFNIPYIVVDYPYGICGTTNFIRSIAQLFNIDMEDEIKSGEEYATNRLKAVYEYLHSLYGLPVCVVGESTRGQGLSDMLQGELGLDTDFYNLGEIKEKEKILDDIKNSNAVMVFGSSYEGDIAMELDLPLIRYTYPVFDTVSISSKSYIGYEGVLYLVEDILNGAMTGTNRREFLYN